MDTYYLSPKKRQRRTFALFWGLWYIFTRIGESNRSLFAIRNASVYPPFIIGYGYTIATLLAEDGDLETPYIVLQP